MARVREPEGKSVAGVMNRFVTLMIGVPFFLIGAGRMLETGIDAFDLGLGILSGVFLVRGLRTGVYFSPGSVRFRGWWRTVRVDSSEAEIEVVPYSSVWNWGAESAIFSCIAVRRGGVQSVMLFTVGPVLRVRKLADDIRAWLR